MAASQDNEHKNKFVIAEHGKEPELMGKKIKIKKKYGDWTVLKDLGTKLVNKKWKHFVLVRCKCGAEKQLRLTNLPYRQLPKCKRCHLRSLVTHGKTYTREYRAWHGMKQRCLNAKGKYYKNYGGRGIKVCDLWLNSFENFYADMGPKPSPQHSMDRINNDGNYEPGNCRWVVKTWQNQNRQKKGACSSKYIGVSFSKTANKWIAQISYKKKCYYLGYFVSEIQAASAYDEKARELYGENAKTNF